jgi:hypothetical protein
MFDTSIPGKGYTGRTESLTGYMATISSDTILTVAERA